MTKSNHISQYDVYGSGELLPFLLERVKGKGRNALKSALARGQVAVNGATSTRHDHQLAVGDRVSIVWGKVAAAPELVGLRIVHEDADVIVVNKDAGLLSIAGGGEKELTAHRQLSHYVKDADPKARIFIEHRLDRDTSGLMVFAKSEKTKLALQQSWSDSVVERIYYALVEGKLNQPEGTIVSWLKESKTLKMFSSPYDNGGKKAITHYKTLRAARACSLLELQLETGRKNQIRAHMEHIGHPVVGDKKYGARTNPLGRLGLHAAVLAFVHPASGETLRFVTDVPGKFVNIVKD